MNMETRYAAAYTQIDITPDYPVDLVSFGRADSMSRGVLSPLLAQILLLRGDNEPCCLITIDNIGLSMDDTARLRATVAAQSHTTPERVMVFFSHSHATPNTDSHAPNGARYLTEMTEKVLACIDTAASGGRPAAAGWGLAHADIIGVNRRPGGTAYDDRVGVLKIVDAQTGEPIAVVLRVTAHGNVLKEDNLLISSDYFGAARGALTPLLGCPVMLTQGAAGDIRPKYKGSATDLKTTAAVLRDAVAAMRRSRSLRKPRRSSSSAATQTGSAATCQPQRNDARAVMKRSTVICNSTPTSATSCRFARRRLTSSPMLPAKDGVVIPLCDAIMNVKALILKGDRYAGSSFYRQSREMDTPLPGAQAGRAGADRRL